MKIVHIIFQGQPIAILDNGGSVPVAFIEGNVSIGKSVINDQGNWKITTGTDGECEV